MRTVRFRRSDSIEELRAALPFSKSGCVAALGFFDGMHAAHRALIKKAREAADSAGLPLTVFTFSGDDGALKPDSSRLYTDEEKLELIAECGADFTVLADFSAISDMSSRDFVHDFLIRSLGVRVSVCGFNFRFGKGASGTSEDLEALMGEAGASALVLEERTKDGISLSSTYIRELISEKKLLMAAKLLGKPYFISGRVAHGLGLGKTLGIPTVNLELPKGKSALPGGVYSTLTEIDEKIYPSLTNVGVCPTFDEREAHAETFILDFNGDLYGKITRIYFIAFLRDEKKFKSAEELIMQINIDKKRALKLTEELKWQEIGLNLR